MVMRTTIELQRRRWLAMALLLPLADAWAAPIRPSVEVWKDPNCGCCKDWVAHLVANGFAVKVNETGSNAMRSQLGIAEKYGSCHTALVAGYALEGHVPARDIKRLLQGRPEGIGLAVPGMPVGSPGMDGPEYGNRKDAYNVLLLKKDGSFTVYQTYDGKKS
ncbi:DUF411 domain-containing protein [Rhodoferax sp.]|uniref:DUF411 domain-containing protein n=1 Tax=Rhodoferax sp. TaxID=50421 RepID=UPI001ED1AC86|nr:DUF411 domain-containing protein [Rhodoferax sp.]MBT9508666.1 DUF411 domain-containing protein [Rhodoferax sp.]